MKQKALYKKILKTLMPYSQDQFSRVYPRLDEDESIPTMFAHYTSAEAALSIIADKRRSDTSRSRASAPN